MAAMVLGGISSSWWGGSSCRLSRSHFGWCVFVSDFGKIAGITAASFTKDKNWFEMNKLRHILPLQYFRTKLVALLYPWQNVKIPVANCKYTHEEPVAKCKIGPQRQNVAKIGPKNIVSHSMARMGTQLCIAPKQYPPYIGPMA